jgi:hypothetical protein
VHACISWSIQTLEPMQHLKFRSGRISCKIGKQESSCTKNCQSWMDLQYLPHLSTIGGKWTCNWWTQVMNLSSSLVIEESLLQSNSLNASHDSLKNKTTTLEHHKLRSASSSH